MRRGGRQWRHWWCRLGLISTLVLGSHALLQAEPINPEKLRVPLTLPGLTGELRSLKFYPNDFSGTLEFTKRKYQKSFQPANQKFINWELVLDHPIARDEAVRFLITAVLSDASGAVLKKSDSLAWIETDMSWSQWGNSFEVANWKPGTYQVAILIKGKEYVKTTFQVTGNEVAAIPTGEDFLKGLNAQVTSLKFFESDRVIPPLGQRPYDQRFKVSQSRFINWELHLQFAGSRSQRVDFDIKTFWYGPDGALVERFTTKHSIQPDWPDSVHASGRGWDEAGKWQPGTYRLVMKINDREVASGSFQMEGEKGVASPGPEVLQRLGATAISLRFFEGEKQPPPLGQRTYQEKFTRPATRFIWWELNLEAAAERAEPLSLKIDETWYGPDGKVMHTFPGKFTVQPEWTRPTFWGSIGFSEPGKWQTGSYRLVLKIGDRVVANGSFQVTGEAQPGADFLQSIGAKVTELKYFESGKTAAKLGERQYLRTFAQQDTRYIYFELNLALTGNRTAPATIHLQSQWYDPKGKLLSEKSTEHLIKPEWVTAALAYGIGWSEPGKWSAGTYRLVVKTQGQEVAAGSFQIR